MILLLLFAFLAGIVTVLSPCILPVLPVVLSGSVGGGKARPLGIISGFIVSFTVFTLALSALVKIFHINADILRWIAAGLIIFFGLVLIIPSLKNIFMAFVSRFTSYGFSSKGNEKKDGYWSGLVLGLSLGLVWTPCVGPIMASIITLALTSTVNFGSVMITLSYAIGTAIPFFLVMQGGRNLLNRFSFFTKHTMTIQKVFGVLMLLTGIVLFTGLDRQFQNVVLQIFPRYGQGLTVLENQDFIKKELENRKNKPSKDIIDSSLFQTLPLGKVWINSKPLTPDDLKNKVVLIDFWTYSCINCIRTLPYLKAWDEKYRNQGLVIIGVHSPEFVFERSTENVKKAVKDFRIKYPVVQDNDFNIWKAFDNRYWPAHYFFDRSGNLVYSHFGEGEYEKSEQIIQTLLGQTSNLISSKIPSTLTTTVSMTPETYLGFKRANAFASPEPVSKNQAQTFTIPSNLMQDQWALSGKWIQNAEYIQSDGEGILELSFRAEKVYLVLGPVENQLLPNIKVTVNGNPVETDDIKNGILKPDGYRLYKLYNGNGAVKGILKLETSGSLKAYAFTFG